MYFKIALVFFYLLSFISLFLPFIPKVRNIVINNDLEDTWIGTVFSYIEEMKSYPEDINFLSYIELTIWYIIYMIISILFSLIISALFPLIGFTILLTLIFKLTIKTKQK